MLSVSTLPILQAVNENREFYFGLQPGLSGRSDAGYVNRNISFNPASNTLTIGVNLNVLGNSLSGNSIAERTITSGKIAPLTRLIESAQLVPGPKSGTINIDLLENTLFFLTANSAGSLSFNLRGNADRSLDSLIGLGESITAVVLVSQGSTQFTANVFVDGVNRSSNTRWLGGNLPVQSSLSGSQIDAFTITTMKTGFNSYTVLASLSSYI